MKYDCSKTLDYAHEVMRMCKQTSCENCLIKHGECISIGIKDITKERIDIVQKWSDEHPEKTRQDAFFEIFPKMVKRHDEGTPALCFYSLIGDSCPYLSDHNFDCEECWNKPYDGEFEKAREKDK